MNGGLLASAVAAISLLAAATFRRRSAAVGVAVTYLVVSYFAASVAEWWPAMRPLGPMTPFWYVDSAWILREGAWPLGDMSVLIAAIVIAAVAGGIIWDRRDLPL